MSTKHTPETAQDAINRLLNWLDEEFIQWEKNTRHGAEERLEYERHLASHEQVKPLIAAAPEMLEALEMLLNETNAGTWDCLPVDKANNAIRKARGE